MGADARKAKGGNTYREWPLAGGTFRGGGHFGSFFLSTIFLGLLVVQGLYLQNRPLSVHGTSSGLAHAKRRIPFHHVTRLKKHGTGPRSAAKTLFTSSGSEPNCN